MILMEPNDQHLCIIPGVLKLKVARKPATKARQGSSHPPRSQ
jgi:hypothetical protein